MKKYNFKTYEEAEQAVAAFNVKVEALLAEGDALFEAIDTMSQKWYDLVDKMKNFIRTGEMEKEDE